MPSTAAVLPPPLLEGDRLDADEFLRRWEAMPELKYAELIDGVVFLSSPLSLDDGTTNRRIAGWLYLYESRTPGTQGGDDVTCVMGPASVPQPDNFLRILPEYDGQSGQSGNYGAGAPELIVEVSGSSLSRDFGVKKELYRSIGVREYVTVELQARNITWRQLVRGR